MKTPLGDVGYCVYITKKSATNNLPDFSLHSFYLFKENIIDIGQGDLLATFKIRVDYSIIHP